MPAKRAATKSSKAPAKASPPPRPPAPADRPATSGDAARWTAVPPVTAWTPAEPVTPWGSQGAPAAVVRVARPTRGVAGALVILLASVVAIAAIDFVFMLLVDDWGAPSAGGPMAGVQTAVSTLGSAASIATVIVFCIWLHRTLSNAKERHPMAGISPGWAVGSFFVPVVHLVLPYFEVRKGWRADVSPDAGPVALWFVPWSLALLGSYVTGVVFIGVALRAFGSLESGGTPDVQAIFEESRPLQILAAGIALPLNALAAFFLARLVRRWTAFQEGSPVS